MKAHLASWGAALAALFLSHSASAQAPTSTTYVYAAKGTFIGYLQVPENGFDTLKPWRLNTDQFIDLVLGNDINVKVPSYVKLGVASDYNSTVSGDASAPKELVVVRLDSAFGPPALLATIITSDTTSVCNAQATNRAFRRYGFGGGNVQTSGNNSYGLTGGRVQMVGVLRRKELSSGIFTPILTESLVGSLDITMNSGAETFFVNKGVITASGQPIGTLTSGN